MAKTRVVWTGLAEHKEVLRGLPDTMTNQTALLAESTANSAAVDIRSAYPVRTGNLRNGVTVSVLNRGGPHRTGRQVKNTAPHAHLFEYGTQARHTSIGANRGSMPPGHVFVPRIIKWRRRFTELVKALLLQHGASKVTG